MPPTRSFIKKNRYWLLFFIIFISVEYLLFDVVVSMKLDRYYNDSFTSASISEFRENWLPVRFKLCLPYFQVLDPRIKIQSNVLSQYGREDAAQKLERIAQAAKQYEIEHGEPLPPYLCDEQGAPLLSWRAALLPYLGEKELYDQIRLDEPWDSEWNSQFAETPKAYQGGIPLMSKCYVPFDKATPFLVVTSNEGETPFSDVYFSSDRQHYQLPKNLTANGSLTFVAGHAGVQWLAPRETDLSTIRDGYFYAPSSSTLSKGIDSYTSYNMCGMFLAVKQTAEDNKILLYSNEYPREEFINDCLLKPIPEK